MDNHETTVNQTETPITTETVAENPNTIEAAAETATEHQTPDWIKDAPNPVTGEDKLTEEQAAAAVAAFQQQIAEQNPAYAAAQVIQSYTKDGDVPNVIRIDMDSEMRGIVVRTNEDGQDVFVETTLDDQGFSHQPFNPEDGSRVIWVCYYRQYRLIFIQTGTDIEQINQVMEPDLREVYKGEDQTYMFNFITAIGSDLIAFNQPGDTERFREIQDAIGKTIGSSHAPLMQLLTTLLSRVKNYKDYLPNWADAETFNVSEKPFSIVWGMRATNTDGEYTNYETTRLAYWYHPIVYNEEGKQVEDPMVNVTTRNLPSSAFPQLAPNSVAEFNITEKVDSNVVGILSLTTDLMTGALTELKLYKSKDFDPNSAISID